MSRTDALSSSTIPPSLLKIVILGDGNVGKSSLLNRYVHNEFDPRCAHTVGVEFLRKEVLLPSGERFSLQIWDTAGQERFRSLQRPFYRGTDICMLVFSVDDKESLENLNSWIGEFQRYAEMDISRFPFVVLGNKIDIGEESRQVTEADARQSCQQMQQNLTATGSSSSATFLPFPYLETSAKDGLNVDEAFAVAVSYMKELSVRSSTGSSPSNVGAGGFKLEPVNLRSVVKKRAKPCC